MASLQQPEEQGNRRRPPQRRPHVSFDVEHEGLRYRCGVGYWPDGHVCELFLSAAKDGSGLDVSARDSSIAVSLALQYGVPLETIARALCRDPRGAASGVLGVVCDLLLQDGGAA
jgi:hypothetical protein